MLHDRLIISATQMRFTFILNYRNTPTSATLCLYNRLDTDRR